MLAIIIIIISFCLISDNTNIINLCNSHLLSAGKIAKLKAFVYHTLVLNKLKCIKLNILNFRALESNFISFHVILSYIHI